MIRSAFQLSAATGQLTAQRLSLPVEIYDPTVNYNETRGRWWGTSINADGEAKRK